MICDMSRRISEDIRQNPYIVMRDGKAEYRSDWYNVTPEQKRKWQRYLDGQAALDEQEFQAKMKKAVKVFDPKANIRRIPCHCSDDRGAMYYRTQ
jgi:hypothetical protein